jgi:hypothetical protein
MACYNPSPGVWICGARSRRKRCSTPNCGGYSELECDAPVQKRPGTPKVGDARLHRERQAIFYVHRIDGESLHISSKSTDVPGAPLQQVTREEWFAKTDATCDRPICRRCAVRVGRLDYCGAHGRAAKQAEVRSA